jgi:isopentenyldiphosphate isomerase
MSDELHPAEYIIEVDDQDNVIGPIDRKIARRDGIRHRIVRIILINPDGQILLQQRAASRIDNPLKWDWSAAGHVGDGESYFDAGDWH